MAKKVNWAFIHLSVGVDPRVDHAELIHGGKRLLIVGTDTVEGGCEIAKYLVEEAQCEFIELCGGWHADGAQCIVDAIDGKIPVGHVEYLPSEYPKMTKVDNQYVPWAFLFRCDGADPAVDHIVVPHCKNRLLIYGTSSVEEGCAVAKRIVDEGCELVELSGDYGPEGAQKVIDAIDGRVPVGHMIYPKE